MCELFFISLSSNLAQGMLRFPTCSVFLNFRSCGMRNASSGICKKSVLSARFIPGETQTSGKFLIFKLVVFSWPCKRKAYIDFERQNMSLFLNFFISAQPPHG